MRIVVTGGNGFIGRNLRARLRELGHHDVVNVSRETSDAERRAALAGADFVFHLAGANRPPTPAEFHEVNTELTREVCAALAATSRRVPIVFTSSTQALLDNPYGQSKREGERVIERYAEETGSPAFVLRLPGVFGKWARPNYNSVVATFCYNTTRGLPIDVHDRSTALTLIYVDDAIESMLALMAPNAPASGLVEAGPTYRTTLGELAGLLGQFASSRETLVIPEVGTGFTRALYATYLSYLPPASFAYALERHADTRGVFVEILKTLGSGQFSYFVTEPGATRGGHYHHTKNEKFLVVQGTARFRFRHIVTDECHEIVVEGDAPQVVETVPGWAHDITNIGASPAVVMLWANEVFDPNRPDTIVAKTAQ